VIRYDGLDQQVTVSRMSPNYTEQAKQRRALVDAYGKLNQQEQLIVQMFSLIYEPVNRTIAMTCCNLLLKSIDQKFKGFVTATFNPIVTRLLTTKLLIAVAQGVRCHPLITEIATRDSIRTKRFEAIVTVIEAQMPLLPAWHNAPIVPKTVDQYMRIARWAIYRQDLATVKQWLAVSKQLGYYRLDINLESTLRQVCLNPFDEDWLQTCPTAMQETILVHLLENSVWQLEPIDDVIAYLEDIYLEAADRTAKEHQLDHLRMVLAEQLLLRNDLAAAEMHLGQISPDRRNDAAEYWGWLAFLKQDDPGAIAIYQNGLDQLRKTNKKRKLFYGGISGLFFILALLREASPGSWAQASEYVTMMTKQNKHALFNLYSRLQLLLQFLQGDLSRKSLLIHSFYTNLADLSSIELLLSALCLYWVDPAQAQTILAQRVEGIYDRSAAAEYHWITMAAAELLARFHPTRGFGERAKFLREDSGVASIIAVIPQTEPWELCLTALTHLVKKDEPVAAATTAEQRLVWTITSYGSSNTYGIQPKEQKISARGGWSKGRPIALSRLHKNLNDFDYLTPQDRSICQQIKLEYQYSRSYYGRDGSYVLGDRAMVELAGHPHVYWENAPDIRLEIVKGEPELLVKKSSKSRELTIQLSPSIKADQTVVVQKETPTRLRVIEVKDNHRRIADILGASNQLVVPIAAQERVLAAISAISGLVTVHSDIGGGMENVEEVPADPKPHVHLLPASGGLRVAVLVKPFEAGGSYYQPGQGGATVVAEIDGKRLQTTRQFKEEKQQAKRAIAACSVLADWPQEEGEWVIDEPSDCLELLLELGELGDAVAIEWPEGEKMRVKYQADSSSFSMNIKRQRDWFEASGELAIGSDDVLNMQQLMQLLDQSSGRFIPLGDGEFIALTDAFRKQLEDLRGYSEKHGDGVRFHPLAALALEDVVDQVGNLKTDKAWKENTKKLKSAQEHQPKLPSTLQADLRDYQVEGFEWLSRLAHWGVGACLADDMGLGKTLQALALMLTRAKDGPSIVIAPLSVSMNWLGEVAKFAPTLNVVQFGSGDRQAVIDALQPLDLFICSYGLLQQDDVAEMLAKVQWQTIVLDEAQAIKNMQTKRSQAAMKLQAGFKLITTGTPIENHLGELWNLFRFINPGLLGSLENFNQKYAGPIEREQDKTARERLKKLIQPFILRRTKNQVLAELPSRTEILLQVELSKEEKAFYEALRQEAIRKLSESDATAGAKHLQVLAEIMKLRRACCNPALVKPKLKIKSSKLELFAETLTELLDNNHKALVFSQFVDHLTIIREYLDQQKISYQYLDGSTPAKERKRRVDAFQAGEGDVFLISLKAGGTGLNLTAADYVIHMDPWWNPAVEDQASDRAHRIGQQRPVTIYRLVAEGTIEAQIVDLHHQKRDLASSLLEGTEMSGKVSTDELLRLIQDV
jgi:superfamily II DNA or RNA helicase